MFSVINRWETLPYWSVTVVDVADGTMTKSRIDVCSKGEGWSIFMLDIDANSDCEATRNNVRVDHSADARWSALARINSKFFQGDVAIASACLAIGTADGLIRVAFADFPSVFVKHRTGSIRRILGGGAPLGLFAEMRFPEKICMLDRGEAVTFVNKGAQRLLDDGLITAHNFFSGRVHERDCLPQLPFAATAITIRRTECAIAEPQHASGAESLVCA